MRDRFRLASHERTLLNLPTQHTTDLRSLMRDPFGIALFAYYIVMAVIGMLIPDDILNYQWAKELSDSVAGIVPQIDRITAFDIKPGVNRFYFSVLWAGSPVFVLLVVWGAVVRGVNKNHMDTNSPFLKPFVSSLIIGLVGYWAFLLPGVDGTHLVFQGLIGNFFIRGMLGQVLFVNGPLLLLAGGYILFPYFLLTGKYKK